MGQATVKVAFVNQPRTNPKWGSIKTEDGTYYSIAADTLPQYQKGQSYNILFETNDKGYHTIKSATPLAPPSTGHNSPPPTNGNGKDRMIGVLAIAKPLIDKVPLTTGPEIENALVICLEASMRAYDRTLGHGH